MNYICPICKTKNISIINNDGNPIFEKCVKCGFKMGSSNEYFDDKFKRKVTRYGR